jgi:hypothetical protein
MKVPMKLVIVMVALAVGIVPAAALANGHGNSQNAPGHNKRTNSGSSSTSTPSARSQAQKQCRQERKSMGEATFDKTYGTNKNGKNAFGKCVSHRTKQDQGTSTQTQSSEVKAEDNAARQCRTEQKADPAAFKDKYGTNGNKSNAFGKCVSQKAHQQEQQSGSGSSGGSDSNGS